MVFAVIVIQDIYLIQSKNYVNSIPPNYLLVQLIAKVVLIEQYKHKLQLYVIDAKKNFI